MPLTVRGKAASPTSPTGSVDVARMLDAARFWSEEWLWHRHRHDRLTIERNALEVWLFRHDGNPVHPRYPYRSFRMRWCHRMLRHHRSELDRVESLLFDLINRQPSDLQGRMTAIWFASKTQPPPPVRPTRSDA